MYYGRFGKHKEEIDVHFCHQFVLWRFITISGGPGERREGKGGGMGGRERERERERQTDRKRERINFFDKLYKRNSQFKIMNWFVVGTSTTVSCVSHL